MSAKTVVDFDLDRYLRNSKKVDLSQLDWDEVPNHEPSDGDVMCLHYMMDSLGLYLFGDSPEGREQMRGIDETIAELPGLEGLTILDDYMRGAERRVAERPGWAGVTPMAGATNGEGRAPTHWVGSEDGRPDVMPSAVERREEQMMEERVRPA